MKIYIPKLVKGTQDQYKIHTDNNGTILCGDQLGEHFVKHHMVQVAVDRIKDIVCDPEGKVCIEGSDGDRKKLQDVLAMFDPTQEE